MYATLLGFSSELKIYFLCCLFISYNSEFYIRDLYSNYLFSTPFFQAFRKDIIRVFLSKIFNVLHYPGKATNLILKELVIMAMVNHGVQNPETRLERPFSSTLVSQSFYSKLLILSLNRLVLSIKGIDLVPAERSEIVSREFNVT